MQAITSSSGDRVILTFTNQRVNLIMVVLEHDVRMVVSTLPEVQCLQ